MTQHLSSCPKQKIHKYPWVSTSLYYWLVIETSSSYRPFLKSVSLTPQNKLTWLALKTSMNESMYLPISNMVILQRSSAWFSGVCRFRLPLGIRRFLLKPKLLFRWCVQRVFSSWWLSPNPFEKYDRQSGSWNPRDRGEHEKIFEVSPPSFSRRKNTDGSLREKPSNGPPGPQHSP